MPAFLEKAKNILVRYNTRTTHIALGVLGVFVLLAFFNAFKNNAEAEKTPEAPRTVVAQTIGESTTLPSQLSYVGTVRAREEAEVRAQKSGVVTSVNYKAGAYVPAGAVIATIQSNAESAAIQSARASVAQAEATLEKIKNGTRTEQLAVLAEQVKSAQTGIATAQTGAQNALLSAHASMDNAFPGGVDVLYSDATSVNPQIIFTTIQNSAKIVAQNNRVTIGDYLARHKTVSVSTAHLDAELERTEQELLFAKDTLDAVLQALSGAVSGSPLTQTQIDAYTASATGARASVLGSLSSISSARAAISGARTALLVAEQNQNEGVTGARPEDVKTAEASVAQARAGLASAQAQFANTRITAPISGTLTTLTIKNGTFAQQFGLVGTMANTNAREVVFYIPPQYAAFVSVGMPARVNDTYDATITEVSRSIDTQARGILVRAALSTKNPALTDGDTASVTVIRDTESETPENADTTLRVPVSALKLKEGNSFLLSVRDGVAILVPVTVVRVEGDTIAVEHALSLDTLIITDARGIREGDAVVVSE